MNKHPYFDEVKFALELFDKEGFKPIGFDDGDGILNTTNDINTIIEGVLSVDDSEVKLQYEDKTLTLYFVLGNEPGVAISDYSYITSRKDIMEKVESICNMVYDNFN